MNANGTNRVNLVMQPGFPPLYFNERKVAGGPDVKSTYNLPFHLVTPRVTNITPLGTTLISQARTVTASSVSGNQEIRSIEDSKKSTCLRKITLILLEWSHLQGMRNCYWTPIYSLVIDHSPCYSIL